MFAFKHAVTYNTQHHNSDSINQTVFTEVDPLSSGQLQWEVWGDEQEAEASSICPPLPAEISMQDVCDTLENDLVLPGDLDVGPEVLHSHSFITSLTICFCHPFQENKNISKLLFEYLIISFRRFIV